MAFGGSNGSRGLRRSDDLKKLDEKLDELRWEADQLETTLAYLERRRGAVESEWVALLEERDQLAARILQGREDEVPAEPPGPPDVAGVKAAQPTDPAPEPWGLEDVLAPPPDWIPPAHTWEIAVAVPTGLPQRRVPAPEVPSWVQPAETAPIWHKLVGNDE